MEVTLIFSHKLVALFQLQHQVGLHHLEFLLVAQLVQSDQQELLEQPELQQTLERLVRLATPVQQEQQVQLEQGQQVQMVLQAQQV
jgi:hypothetical protein